MTDFKVFSDRRSKLGKSLPEGSLIIMAAASESHRNGDVEFPYRQESNFYYLTGFAESNAWLVIKTGQHPQSILFNQKKDPLVEIWTGARVGQIDAVKDYRFNESFPVTEIEERLPALLQGCQRVYFLFSDEHRIMPTLGTGIMHVREKLRAGGQPPTEFIDLNQDLSEMRLIKSSAEIALMKKAAQITVDAHLRAMRETKSEMFEYQIEAEIIHEFMRQGSRYPSYGSIVAGGINSCTLHYTANNKPLRSGDLLLIDAGAEYDYYASDVTRTFPVNGKFTEEQRKIYELVLSAQEAVIHHAKPGVKWGELQTLAVEIITQGLVDLGILTGRVNDLIESKAYQAFYMHNIGHWLGMDVHDVGSYKVNNEWRELRAGMVFTVEPGIYISPEAPVELRWRGIGVRIEDDVLVTAKGCEVLTDALPKKVQEIESLMSQSSDAELSISTAKHAHSSHQAL